MSKGELIVYQLESDTEGKLSIQYGGKYVMQYKAPNGNCYMFNRPQLFEMVVNYIDGNNIAPEGNDR